MGRKVRPKSTRLPRPMPGAPNKRRSPSGVEVGHDASGSRIAKIIAKWRVAIGAVARVLAAIAITGATVWSGVAAYRHATTSEYFAVTDFDITGAKRLAKGEILRTAGLANGDNIFKIDLERCARALEEHPWISEATVQRQLPRRIVVSLTERVAVAVANFDVPYLVDDTGQVFKRWVRGDPIPAPVITGLAREQFIDDRALVQERLQDAIDLANRYRAGGLQRTAPLAEIHCEQDGGFSLALGPDSVYVRFGRGPYRKKLSRLATLLAKLKRDKERPSMIFFDNEVRPDRITVKLKVEKSASGDQSEASNTRYSQKRLSKI